MKERRKAKRFSLTYRTGVFDAETNQKLGNLMDISTDGAMVISDKPIPTGKTYQLKLSLDGNIADKPFLEMIATSIWCHPDVDPGSYNAGFEIIEIKPEDLEIISRIAVNYGLR